MATVLHVKNLVWLVEHCGEVIGAMVKLPSVPNVTSLKTNNSICSFQIPDDI
jgi:hypothetical protein